MDGPLRRPPFSASTLHRHVGVEEGGPRIRRCPRGPLTSRLSSRDRFADTGPGLPLICWRLKAQPATSQRHLQTGPTARRSARQGPRTPDWEIAHDPGQGGSRIGAWWRSCCPPIGWMPTQTGSYSSRNTDGL